MKLICCKNIKVNNSKRENSKRDESHVAIKKKILDAFHLTNLLHQAYFVFSIYILVVLFNTVILLVEVAYTMILPVQFPADYTLFRHTDSSGIGCDSNSISLLMSVMHR